ncbi:hypothetical protein L208DRAFT_607178 [Tricholoma matsutake]|nr:hypothetical protein L208DRAFT_607178 [Tricholoma matsutake 945]
MQTVTCSSMGARAIALIAIGPLFVIDHLQSTMRAAAHSGGGCLDRPVHCCCPLFLVVVPASLPILSWSPSLLSLSSPGPGSPIVIVPWFVVKHLRSTLLAAVCGGYWNCCPVIVVQSLLLAVLVSC